MTDILSPALIAAVAIAAVLGGVIGVGLMLLIQRSQSGGKSLSDLRQEQEDYQQAVEAHFERTGALFKDMTENYRALYEHMATGAQALCKGEPAIAPPALGQSEAPTDEASQIAQTGDETDVPSPGPAAETAMPGAEAEKERDAASKQAGKTAPQDVLKEERRDS